MAAVVVVVVDKEFVVHVAPIDVDRVLTITELLRSCTEATGSVGPSSFQTLDVQSMASQLTLILNVLLRDSILQVTDNLKIEADNDSLNIEEIQVGQCNRLIELAEKAIALWLSWHDTGRKTLLRQDRQDVREEEEEAQQPSPKSPEIFIMAIKCVFETKQANWLNLENAPPQTLITFGKNLREIIKREPEQLGAVDFLNSIKQKESLPTGGGHLNECMDAVIKIINTQFRLVKDMLMQFFNEDKVSQAPISLEMLGEAWGEDGSLQMSSELAETLAKEDKVVLLQKIDQLSGVSQILGEMSDDDRESENVWSGKSLELRTVSIALSAVLKAFTCQKAVNVVSCSDEEKQESYKEDVATYFADFCVENQNLGKQSNQAEDLKISLQPTLDALKSFHDYMKMTLTSYMRAVMIPLHNAVEEVSTHSPIDLKPIQSGAINNGKLQELLQSLLDINKNGLMDCLKNMSTYLKAFEKFQSSCPDIKHVDGQNFYGLGD